jgi:hypothetical protein
MEVTGYIHNGVVVFDNGISLPEGMSVVVSIPQVEKSARKEGKRVEFPLVRSQRPGTLHLTNDQIAEILENEDVPTRH